MSLEPGSFLEGLRRIWRLPLLVRLLGAAGVLLLAAMAIGYLGGDGGQSAPDASTNSAPDATPSTLEYRLAVVEAGGFVPENDITVRRFRTLLDRLDAKCSESRQSIADMAATVKDLLDDQGVAISMIDLMEYADEAPVGDCVDAFSAFTAAND